MRLISVTINFHDCEPGAMLLVVASLPWECFGVSMPQDDVNAKGQHSPRKRGGEAWSLALQSPVWQLIIPLTWRRSRLLEIPCAPFSDANIPQRDWTLPGRGRHCFWVLCAWGWQQQYLAVVWIPLSQRKSPPHFLKTVNQCGSVCCGRNYFSSFRLTCIFLNLVYNAFFLPSRDFAGAPPFEVWAVRQRTAWWQSTWFHVLVVFHNCSFAVSLHHVSSLTYPNHSLPKLQW